MYEKQSLFYMFCIFTVAQATIDSVDLRQLKNEIINEQRRLLQEYHNKNTELLAEFMDDIKRQMAALQTGAEITDAPPVTPIPYNITWKDCADAYKTGYTRSGVFLINVGSLSYPVEVYCDQESNGGGWTVFQRRVDDSLSFFKYWNEFKTGFGNVTDNFWLGNDILATMMDGWRPRHTLRIDIMSFEDEKRYAEYQDFQIMPESEKYMLKIGAHSGTAPDGGLGLSYHNNMKFTTLNKDWDWSSGGNCAQQTGGGGWWYKNCVMVSLNAMYVYPPKRGRSYIIWEPWQDDKPLKWTEMKFRPADF